MTEPSNDGTHPDPPAGPGPDGPGPGSGSDGPGPNKPGAGTDPDGPDGPGPGSDASGPGANEPGASGPGPSGPGPSGPDPYDLAAFAGLARVLVYASWRLATWSVGTSLRTGTHVLRRAAEGDPPGRIVADLAGGVNGFVRDLLDLPAEAPRPAPDTAPVTLDDLRARGAELLRRSAALDDFDEGHPAYARILADLLPDEARILRFLYLNGPQPMLDIRTGRPFGIGSALIGGGLNMVAEHAGLRYLDRTGCYLTNLGRLGLLEFSPDPVDDPGRYQLVEAQPKVAEVIATAGWAPRIVHRSIRLTDFGQDFCATCLPVD